MYTSAAETSCSKLTAPPLLCGNVGIVHFKAILRNPYLEMQLVLEAEFILFLYCCGDS